MVGRPLSFLALIAARLDAACPRGQGNKVRPQQKRCGFTAVVAIESPPSKEESTQKFLHFDGAKRAQKTRSAVKGRKSLSGND